MAKPQRTPSRPLRPITDPAKLKAVIDAVSEYDVSSSPAWNELDSLSTHTYFEEVEPVPEGIFETEDDGFSAAATVYVQLNYGDKNDDVSAAETLPAQADGHFTG